MDHRKLMQLVRFYPFIRSLHGRAEKLSKRHPRADGDPVITQESRLRGNDASGPAYGKHAFRDGH